MGEEKNSNKVVIKTYKNKTDTDLLLISCQYISTYTSEDNFQNQCPTQNTTEMSFTSPVLK